MNWLGFLTRARRLLTRAGRPAEPHSTPVGMDYLRVQAGIAQPDTPPPEPPAPQPPAVVGISAETMVWAEEASWEALNEAAEERQKQQDWSAAEPLWRTMLRRHSHIWHAYVGGPVALSGLGRFDEALFILTEGSHRFPLEPAIRHELGRLAARQGDWPAAVLHWRAALGFKVRPTFVYTELAKALTRLDRPAEAEAVLLEAREPKAIQRFTYTPQSTSTRADWPTAVALLAEAYQRFPASPELSDGISRALAQLAEHEPLATDVMYRELAMRAVMAATGGDRQALMPRFESLGGLGPAGGCEFGAVQRSYGFESLSLFRWASVSPESLIACLTNRFDGLGSSDSTMIYINIDDQELLWQIADKTYNTAMHSFVRSAEIPYAEMMIRARKRMDFLKEKLIADLEAAEKIFVLKVGHRHLTLAETVALSHAIRSYGMGQLLCVCPADSMHPAGHVVPAAPGVFVGYIDFSGQLSEVKRYLVWEVLCWSMLALSDFTHIIAR